MDKINWSVVASILLFMILNYILMSLIMWPGCT